MATQALGILETRSLVSALVGADAMLKAAEVSLIGRNQTPAGQVAVMVGGDVASVRAAVEAGAAAAAPYGEVTAGKVLPCPHEEVDKLLPTLG